MVEAVGAEPTLAMGQAGLITQGQVASGPDRRRGLSMTRATGRGVPTCAEPVDVDIEDLVGGAPSISFAAPRASLGVVRALAHSGSFRVGAQIRR